MSNELTSKAEELNQVFLGLAVKAQQQIPESFDKTKKVIIIAGPTGCGKTEFALKLAKMIKGEIISGDSMQVYRGMDIGTAKPTAKEQADVPHHLVDVRNVNEPFNVVDYYYEARQACEQILARNNVPIVVGGSGFYLHSLLYGPPSGPPSIPEVREKIQEQMEEFGPEALYDRLLGIDPQYAKSITKNDKQKIVRALEIITLSGQKVSDLSWKQRHKPLNYDYRCWFLFRPREHLYKRINQRCERMVEAGFLDEVKALVKEGIHANSTAANAIGYRQALEYFETAQTPEDFERFMTDFKTASRHYAKRQRTWFAREPLFQWVDMDLHDYEVILDMIGNDYLRLS